MPQEDSRVSSKIPLSKVIQTLKEDLDKTKANYAVHGYPNFFVDNSYDRLIGRVDRLIAELQRLERKGRKWLTPGKYAELRKLTAPKET